MVACLQSWWGSVVFMGDTLISAQCKFDESWVVAAEQAGRPINNLYSLRLYALHQRYCEEQKSSQRTRDIVRSKRAVSAETR